MSTDRPKPPIDWKHEKEWLGSLLDRIVLRPHTRAYSAGHPAHRDSEAERKDLRHRSSDFFGMSVIEMCAEGCTPEDLLELESLFVEAFGDPSP